MAERFSDDLILLEKIAAGGMAEVYRAKQLGYGGFEKTVALKRILQNFAQNEDFKQMFRMEANLSGQLQNSNIVQVFGNGEHQGYLYLLMEFVDGKNVRQMLARADRKKIKIPIEFALYIVSEAAKGLEYAHEFIDEKTSQHLEIVHRDMSPQNIMLSYDGGIKIVDFGIAKAAARSGQTRAGVLKGKFGYMSPEQAQGMNIDRRTDIFALGIILFELLTQRRLFTADDDLKTLQLVKDCRVPRPSKYNPDVNDQLDNIVLKALSKERTERFDRAGDFYAEITRYLNQKFPSFLPTDFSKFIRELFSEDIKEEKRKREKMNAEMPAKLAPVKKPPPPSSEVQKKSEADTEIPDRDDTDKGSVTEKGTATEASKTLPDLPSQDLSEKSRANFKMANSFSGKQLSLVTKEKELRQMEGGAQGVYSGTELRPSPHQTGISSVRIQKILTPSKQSRKVIFKSAFLLVLALSGYAYWEETQSVERSPANLENSEELITMDQVEDENSQVDIMATEIPSKESPSIPETPTSSQAELPLLEPKKNTLADIPIKPLRPADRPVRAVGYVDFSSTPEAGEIYVGGRRLEDEKGTPLRTPLKKYPLAPGKYKIVLKNSFFGVEYRGEFVVDANRQKEISVVLSKQ